MSGQVFFEGRKDVRCCAGSRVVWVVVVVSLVLSLGVCGVGVGGFVVCWGVSAGRGVGKGCCLRTTSGLARQSDLDAIRASLHGGATLICLM